MRQRHLVVGFDAAWSGVGWSVGDQDGPAEVGWFAPGRKTWRMHAMVDGLIEVDNATRLEEATLGPGDPKPRAAVERIPWVYRGRGNQAATGYGVGTCVGCVLLWGMRDGWGYPWEIPPSTRGKAVGWRDHWGIRGGGRDALKAKAISVVRASGWGRFLAELDLDFPGEGKPWPAGDLAGGILLRVAASRMHEQGPAGPKRRRR